VTSWHLQNRAYLLPPTVSLSPISHFSRNFIFSYLLRLNIWAFDYYFSPSLIFKYASTFLLFEKVLSYTFLFYHGLIQSRPFAFWLPFPIKPEDI
jgi:hypothetical protein